MAGACPVPLAHAGATPRRSSPTSRPTTLVPPTSASDFTAEAARQRDGRQLAHRAANRARDVYRHPKATLQFFGVQPDQTVDGNHPGGGWYSEILAPLLRDNGHYIAAVQAPTGDGEARRDDSALHRKFAADAGALRQGHASSSSTRRRRCSAPPGSADVVLTFRNVHNWVDGGYRAGDVQGVLRGACAPAACSAWSIIAPTRARRSTRSSPVVTCR